MIEQFGHKVFFETRRGCRIVLPFESIEEGEKYIISPFKTEIFEKTIKNKNSSR